MYSVLLSNDIYPKQAVLDAKNAYANYAEFKIERTNSSTLKLIISPKPRYQSDAREICLEFLNYALDCSIQISLERESSDIDNI